MVAAAREKEQELMSEKEAREEAAGPPPPAQLLEGRGGWQEIPSGVGALKMVELQEGLCAKVGVYELRGRNTVRTPAFHQF